MPPVGELTINSKERSPVSAPTLKRMGEPPGMVVNKVVAGAVPTAVTSFCHVSRLAREAVVQTRRRAEVSRVVVFMLGKVGGICAPRWCL